jgi:hypothetical protein
MRPDVLSALRDLRVGEIGALVPLCIWLISLRSSDPVISAIDVRVMSPIGRYC